MRAKMEKMRQVVKTTWGLTKAIRQSINEICETTEVMAHERARTDLGFKQVHEKIGWLKKMVVQVTVSEV